LPVLFLFHLLCNLFHYSPCNIVYWVWIENMSSYLDRKWNFNSLLFVLRPKTGLRLSSHFLQYTRTLSLTHSHISFYLSLSLSLSVFLSLSLSLSNTHTHTNTLSLCFFLSNTHAHLLTFRERERENHHRWPKKELVKSAYSLLKMKLDFFYDSFIITKHIFHEKSQKFDSKISFYH